MFTMLCVFIHRYRWGYQIRGDERGFFEKAKIYKSRNIKLLVVERKPSIKDNLEPHAYESLFIRSGHLPLRNILDLGLILCNAFTIMLNLKERPDLVYAYNQDPENVIVGYLAKLIFRLPMVVVYHHISPSSFETFREGILRRRIAGQSVIASIWHSLIPHINRICVKKANVHLALSYATAQEVKNYLDIRECAVIGNGVDTITFRNLGLERKFDSIFLGRLAQQKGIDVLLSAWAEVVKKLPSAQLIIVGGGDLESIKRYKNMAASLGLLDSVRFTGFVGDKELVNLLNSAKIFVFPSRKEGFAQAVSQAMACGLCCILSDIPSLREVYGEAAVYFPCEDHLALANLIVEYLQNEQLRLKKAEEAEEYVKDMKWTNVVENELLQIRNGIRKDISI
jgi:glycosyltransferase involved in cell wall biosynthesis